MLFLADKTRCQKNNTIWKTKFKNISKCRDDIFSIVRTELTASRVKNYELIDEHFLLC